jgi:hypothetical protein
MAGKSTVRIAFERLPEAIRNAYGSIAAAAAVMQGTRMVEIDVQPYASDVDRIDVWVWRDGEWQRVRNPRVKPALL